MATPKHKHPAKPAAKPAPSAKRSSSLGPAWDAIVTAVEASRAKLGIQLPDELAVPGVDAAVAVRALHLELGKDKHVGIVELLRQLIEIEGTALDALAEFLFHQWIASTRGSPLKWLVDAAGAIGGPRTISQLGAFLSDRIHDQSAHHQVMAVATALSRSPSLAGAHEILMLAETPSRYVRRREDARGLFREIAKRHELTPEKLVLACAPRDADPKWRARIEAVWARHCERMMVEGARLTFGALRLDVLEHPIRGPVTRRMIFGTCGRDKRLVGSFRPATSGPVDAAGKPTKIDDKTQVGVAHPVELAELEQLAAWQELLAQQDAAQPMQQLERTVRDLSEVQRATSTLTDFRTYRREWLHEQGWEADKVDSDWAGDADTFVLVAVRDGAVITCSLAGDTSIETITAARTKQPVTFGSLSAVTRSELLYALLGQDVRRRAAPNQKTTKPAVSSPSPAYPFAELAKTGRSTCVQCEQKIAKGETRVAIERLIESEQYRGTGAGYLHAACVADHAPLAELRDRDATIAANSEVPWPPSKG